MDVLLQGMAKGEERVRPPTFSGVHVHLRGGNIRFLGPRLGGMVRRDHGVDRGSINQKIGGSFDCRTRALDALWMQAMLPVGSPHILPGVATRGRAPC